MRQDMRQSWRNPSLIQKWNPCFSAMFVMISAQLIGNWGNTVLRQNTRFWGSLRVPLAQRLTSINANWTFTMMLHTWNWKIILVTFVENNLEGHLLSELTWLQFTLRTGELVCEECLIHVTIWIKLSCKLLVDVQNMVLLRNKVDLSNRFISIRGCS